MQKSVANAELGIQELKTQNRRLEDMVNDFGGIISRETDVHKVRQEEKLKLCLRARLIEDDITTRILNQQ